MAAVSVRKISKYYGKRLVLDKVSFSIKKGEIFGLLGSNGAGKSTLTRIMLSLEQPTEGRVRLGTAKNPRIAFVPQDLSFYRDFSVRKNIEYFASIYGAKGSGAGKVAAGLEAWLGLSEFSSSKAKYLSGGYQRLLNIAAALVNDPQIIFLDEPTVALDPKMRRMLWEKITELKKKGKTIILTTHYMDEAEELCSRAALLKNGKLLTVGRPADLIKKHGGKKAVSFDLKEHITGNDIEELTLAVKSEKIVTKENFIFIPVKKGDGLAESRKARNFLKAHGYTIISSTTREPSLEDVFLNLTGEKMGGVE